MVKKIGLSRDHKPMFKILPFHADVLRAGPLYHQSKLFYRAFQLIRENQRISIGGGEIFEMPNDCPGPSLVCFHLAVELMLKALIALKSEPMLRDEKFRRTHDLRVLLEGVLLEYPEIAILLRKTEYELLIEELSVNFDKIRYLEGTLVFRPNNKAGWQTKKPLAEFNEACDDIFATLKKTFEVCRAKSN